MEVSLVNIGMAFLEGVASNSTKCTLPILVMILCGSLTGGTRRLLGVTCGFVIVFACFTFFSRMLVEASGLDLDIYRLSAFLFTGLFGLLTASDYLHGKFNHLTQIFAGINEKNLTEDRNNFAMGLLLGTLLALAWSPKSNEVLSVITTQTIIQKLPLNSLFILLVFALGAVVPTLFITILGQAVINKSEWLHRNLHLIHKLCGLIILITICWVAHQYSYSAPIFTVDKNGESIYQDSIVNGVSKPYPAPPINGITAWINTPPLTPKDLQGKVVLVYFWTYSCIHCVHVLPSVINWYNNYHDNGLLIIGIHTPEFDFEKNIENVQNAVTHFNIPFPVAVDNNFITWRNFHNQNWPSYYLIDKMGNVVYEYVGEGDYTTLENNIRYLLGFNTIAAETTVDERSPLLIAGSTPGIHLGSGHTKGYAGTTSLDKDTTKQYYFPTTLPDAAWALSGKWTVAANNITAAANNAAIKIRFHSKQVLAVMGAHNNQSITVKILLDNKEVHTITADMRNSIITVDSPRLYEILNFDKPLSGELELIAPRGLEIYTFSFDDY